MQLPLHIIMSLIIYCLSCFGEKPAQKTHMDTLGLLLVCRGRDGRSVAAVDGPGNEPLTLCILFFLKAIEQIQLRLFEH